jgi:competence protein ComFC
LGNLKKHADARLHFNRLGFHIYQLAWNCLDWLYPPSCGGCGKNYTRWCQDCQSRVHQILGPICRCCGGVLSTSGLCQECENDPPTYSALRSFAIYEGPIRRAIHNMKYEGDIALAEILARPMIGYLENVDWKINLVVPVPSSKERRKIRGYNQASLLAFPVALSCSISYEPKALLKIRETHTQVGLSLRERKENVLDAFYALKDKVERKNILVIDDVATSGATMAACAKALMEQGAKQVYGLTLARAIF